MLSIRPSTPAVGITGAGEASYWLLKKLIFLNKNRFSGEKIVYFSLYDVLFFYRHKHNIQKVTWNRFCSCPLKLVSQYHSKKIQSSHNRINEEKNVLHLYRQAYRDIYYNILSSSINKQFVNNRTQKSKTDLELILQMVCQFIIENNLFI